MAHRFYIPQDKINKEEGTSVLDSSEYVHAHKVLRLNVGYDIEFIDGVGSQYEGVIVDGDGRSFQIKIKKHGFIGQEYSLSVFVGLAKAQKMELITRALTEIGATTIGSFISKYSVPKSISQKKQDRLKKITVEAIKQSGRLWLPKITKLMDFNDLLEIIDKNSIVFYEKEHNLAEFSTIDKQKLSLVIGPEGGFAKEEIAAFKKIGARICGLSDSILRVETAAISASAIVRYSQLLAKQR